MTKEEEIKLNPWVIFTILAIVGMVSVYNIGLEQGRKEVQLPKEAIAANIEYILYNADGFPFMISWESSLREIAEYYKQYAGFYAEERGLNQARPILENIMYTICYKNITETQEISYVYFGGKK